MTTAIRGLTPQESPLPEPELSLGNIVRLKKPYIADRGTKYTHGIIVEHVGYNAFGKPMVSLHVYDDKGLLHKDKGSMIPAYVDFCASDLVLLAIAKDDQLFPQGFDLYPTCPTCHDQNQHPFKEDGRCPDCHGWGHVREMQRLGPLRP
jgi:hypothetical protein